MFDYKHITRLNAGAKNQIMRNKDVSGGLVGKLS
jgi:hypothetical protein